MINLLEETIDVLERNGAQPDGVFWCGSEEFGYFSWEDFSKLADIEYDNGLGGQNIASDLLIVGFDFWMERTEYDGAEEWAFRTMPVKPKGNNRVPETLCNGDVWATLKEMNRPGGKYEYL